MINKKINLLITTQGYKQQGRLFRYIPFVTVSFAFFVTAFAIIFVVLDITETQKINSLNNQKEQLLSTIKQQSDNEGKLIYISKKINYMDQSLKDDAQFGP